MALPLTAIVLPPPLALAPHEPWQVQNENTLHLSDLQGPFRESLQADSQRVWGEAAMGEVPCTLINVSSLIFITLRTFPRNFALFQKRRKKCWEFGAPETHAPAFTVIPTR